KALSEKESAKKAGGGRKKSLGRKRGRKTDDEERAKKQKLDDDDAEKAELKECLNIVEDEVEVIEPLSAKAHRNYLMGNTFSWDLYVCVLCFRIKD
ncbi:hypothetical protein Tco_0742974, partial [Tanacetum coccineum]